MDGKTGLLNAAAWHDKAERALTLAALVDDWAALHLWRDGERIAEVCARAPAHVSEMCRWSRASNRVNGVVRYAWGGSPICPRRGRNSSRR